MGNEKKYVEVELPLPKLEEAETVNVKYLQERLEAYPATEISVYPEKNFLWVPIPTK